MSTQNITIRKVLMLAENTLVMMNEVDTNRILKFGSLSFTFLHVNADMWRNMILHFVYIVWWARKLSTPNIYSSLMLPSFLQQFVPNAGRERENSASELKTMMIEYNNCDKLIQYIYILSLKQTWKVSYRNTWQKWEATENISIWRPSFF